MGFDSGLYVYPKYKDYSYKDYLNITFALEDSYSSFDYNVVDDDAISFFSNYAAKRGSNNPYRDLGGWGSSSRSIYEIIANYKEAVDQEHDAFELNYRDIVTVLEYLFEEFTKKYTIKRGSINYSFRLVDDSDENITLNKCDGVEFVLIDENNEEQRFREYTSDECQADDPNLGIVANFDFWEYYTFIDVINSFITALETVDFDKEVVFFEASW